MKIGYVDYGDIARHEQAAKLKEFGCTIIYGAGEPDTIEQALRYMPAGGVLCVPNIGVLNGELDVRGMLAQCGGTLEALDGSDRKPAQKQVMRVEDSPALTDRLTGMFSIIISGIGFIFVFLAWALVGDFLLRLLQFLLGIVAFTAIIIIGFVVDYWLVLLIAGLFLYYYDSR
jgi:hypothetical protein